MNIIFIIVFPRVGVVVVVAVVVRGIFFLKKIATGTILQCEKINVNESQTKTKTKTKTT